MKYDHLGFFFQDLSQGPPEHAEHTCGDTNVFLPPPVALPPEFSSLNDFAPCADPVGLEAATQDQQASLLWVKERACRLTASNFGSVLRRKAKPTDKFLSSIFIPRTINAASLNYGRKMETVAKEVFRRKHSDSHFHACGFVVAKEFSFLGATPDAKVCVRGESGIMEVKCPFSARNLTINEACDTIKNFFLKKNGENVSLNTGHVYYAQIQGQLMITGCKFCIFVVYTQRDLHVERILPDIKFMEDMLRSLASFFKTHAVPYLTARQTDA